MASDGSPPRYEDVVPANNRVPIPLSDIQDTNTYESSPSGVPYQTSGVTPSAPPLPEERIPTGSPLSPGDVKVSFDFGALNEANNEDGGANEEGHVHIQEGYINHAGPQQTRRPRRRRRRSSSSSSRGSSDEWVGPLSGCSCCGCCVFLFFVAAIITGTVLLIQYANDEVCKNHGVCN